MDVVMLPTLVRGEQLAKDGVILAGGPVAGRVALRLIVKVESSAHLRRIADQHSFVGCGRHEVMPLIECSEQRACTFRRFFDTCADGRMTQET